MGFCSWWIACNFCRIWFVGNISQTRNGVTRFKKRETLLRFMHRNLVIPTRPILNVSVVTRYKMVIQILQLVQVAQLMRRKNCKSLSDRDWVKDSNVIRCWYNLCFSFDLLFLWWILCYLLITPLNWTYYSI